MMTAKVCRLGKMISPTITRMVVHFSSLIVTTNAKQQAIRVLSTSASLCVYEYMLAVNFSRGSPEGSVLATLPVDLTSQMRGRMLSLHVQGHI